MQKMSYARRGVILGYCGLLILSVSLGGCSESSRPTDTNGGTDTTGLKTSDFQPASDCRSCHPDQYAEWTGSMHAYALRDPVWAEVRRIGQSAYINALSKACEQCHSPIGSRSDEIPWGPFDVNEMSAVSRDAIGCDLCHTIAGISRLSNGGVMLAPGKTKYGTIKNPIGNTTHASEFQPLYSASEYCGACHDFITDGGLELETTFREWRERGFAVTGKTCNQCHMPEYRGAAALGGPERTLHHHTMVGADLALIDFPGKPQQRDLVTAMLRDALTMDVTTPSTAHPGERVECTVRLTNDKTGHNVPSGVPFNRQMWLSVVVRDGHGSMIYSSGQLDANDDLMNRFSAFPRRDSALFNAQASMLRADSVWTGFTWDAVYLDNPSIRPGETRTVNYSFAVPAEADGALTVDVVLRFRTFPPFVIRALGLNSLLPIPITDMAQATRTITLP